MTNEVAAAEGTVEAVRFWSAIEDGRLVFQRCLVCAHAVFPPHALCPTCSAPDLVWEESNGMGVVLTFTQVPATRANGETVFAAVRLFEGFVMLSRVVGSRVGDIEMGAEVRMQIEKFDRRLIPLFVMGDR